MAKYGLLAKTVFLHCPHAIIKTCGNIVLHIQPYVFQSIDFGVQASSKTCFCEMKKQILPILHNTEYDTVELKLHQTRLKFLLRPSKLRCIFFRKFLFFFYSFIFDRLLPVFVHLLWLNRVIWILYSVKFKCIWNGKIIFGGLRTIYISQNSDI